MTNGPILVTGGTGTLGRHLVPRLRDSGRELRLLSRSVRESENGVEYVTGDLLKGEGIENAFDGVKIVIHCAGGPKGDDVATRNLVTAMSGSEVQHLLYISVIGADRLPLGYFRAKHGAEQAVTESGVPWTTLRAAQFHDFVYDVARKMAKMPVLPVPSAIRFQPVEVDEVAARLAELAAGEPAGLVTDIAGPKVYKMAELVRDYLRASGKHRLIMRVRLPGKAGKAYRAGENLNLDAAMGTRTWEDYLADRVKKPATS